MINAGDTVKIIKPTQDASGEPGELKEYIPIGTVCKVINVEVYKDCMAYECVSLSWSHDTTGFWYLEDEIEKGHYEWVKDEQEETK